MTSPTATLAPRPSLAERRRRRIDLALRAAFVVVLVLFAIFRPIQAGDAIAYWKVDLADPYTRPVATQDAFTYPPPAALFFAVLGRLPFEVFEAIWTLLIGLALLWLAGPWSLLVVLIPVVASDLYLGNIHILLAAAIVAGFRRPGLWAFATLTKPTVGVALLWFLVRREWRPLAIALGLTAAIVAVSIVVDGSLWPQWISTLTRASGAGSELGGPLAIPLLIRVPAAVVLVAWGAWTDRKWTMPVGATIAMPVLFIAVFSVLAALVAIDRPELRPQPRYSEA